MHKIIYAILLTDIHNNNVSQLLQFKSKCNDKWSMRRKIIRYMKSKNITDYRIVKTLYDYEYDSWENKRKNNTLDYNSTKRKEIII